MTGAQTYALAVPVGLVLYAILRNRLAAFVQPLRIAAAEKGEELMVDSRMSAESKEYLSWWMDHAYSGSMTLKMCLMAPFAALLFIWNHRDLDPLRAVGDAGLRKAIKSVVNRLAFAHIAASPILGPMLVLEFLFAGLLLAIFGGSLHFFLRMLTAVENGVSMRGHHNHA